MPVAGLFPPETLGVAARIALNVGFRPEMLDVWVDIA